MSKLKLESKKSSKLNICQKRIFNEEFKREKVKELNAGLYSITSFCKLRDMTSPAVYRWIYLYSPKHKKGVTYYNLRGIFYYIVLIMDAAAAGLYSRKIIGYSVADNMRAEYNCQALEMAFTKT